MELYRYIYISQYICSYHYKRASAIYKRAIGPISVPPSTKRSTKTLAKKDKKNIVTRPQIQLLTSKLNNSGDLFWMLICTFIKEKLDNITTLNSTCSSSNSFEKKLYDVYPVVIPASLCKP